MKLNNLLKVGNALRIFYREKSPSNRVIHIRAIIDDSIYVCRWWSRQYGGGWRYICYEYFELEMLFNDGHLKKA